MKVPAPGGPLCSLRRAFALFLIPIGVALAGASEPRNGKFNLPADTAERSLKRFSEQAGLQVLFPTALVEGLRTQAVKGEMKPFDALTAMFAGTNLKVIQTPKSGAFTLVREDSIGEPKNAPGAALNPSSRPTKPTHAAEPAGVTPKVASQGGNDETIQLTPFEVSAQGIVGYGTTSSLSASRLAMPITDIPASVITINENLIADTVAVDMRDTFNLVSGVNHGNQGTGLQEQAVTSIRGYRSSGAFRDGLPDLNYTDNGGFDYGIMERVEIIKGPSGALYGQHNAGGVINLISKRPLSVPMTKISLTAGSYNLWRTEIDRSGFLGQSRRLGYRLSVSALDTDGAVGIAGEPKDVSYWINPSLSYQFKNGLKVWVWSAFVDDNSKRVSYSTFAFGTQDGRGRPYMAFMEQGKNSVIYQNFINSKNTNYEVGASQSFKLFGMEADLRLVGRYGDRFDQFDRTRSDGAARFIDANGLAISTIGGGLGLGDYEIINGKVVRFGRVGLLYNVGQTNLDQTDFVGDMNLGFNLGPTSHKLLLTAQISHSNRLQRTANNAVADVARLPADIRAQFRFDTRVAGIGLSEIWPNPPSGMGDLRGIILQYATTRATAIPQTLERDLQSLGLVDSVSVFKNRLILVGGVRSDRDETVTGQPQTVGFIPRTTSVTQLTGKFGAVAKIYAGERGELSAFYNNGDTFVPVSTLDTRLATLGEKFPNRTIKTSEIGAKLNLFGSRAVGTVSYFDNQEVNVVIQDFDLDGTITGIKDAIYSFPGGTATTKGYECDLAFSPVRGLSLLTSYSRMRSLLPSALLRGVRLPARPNDGIPARTMSSVVRYEFQRGLLKGFSASWIYTMWGESWTSITSGFLLPSGDLHTAVLGYQWRNYNVRLRIENLEDKFDSQPSTFWTGVGVTKPLNFRLNLTARF